ncbi:MAG TPA: glycoside hydrolase family 43 protein [Marmoricola sp.]|nr:glycoside hydrolase family 43 protein [Marmoricola sp.]
MHRSRTLLTLLCLGLALGVVPLTLLGPATARSSVPAPKGQDPIVPGTPYTGDFPDPWILRVGGHYFAYSTTSDGLNLPLLTSTDTRTWFARKATASSPNGDGLPATPAWAGATGPWAPSVTRLGKHDFVLAYAVQVAGAPGTRMCVSLARATSPIGPFVDTSTAPAVCRRRGAIDPQVFVPPTGHPWLVWKKDHFPARLVTQPMNRAATRVRPGIQPRFLAKVTQPWEGSIIENPAMIRFKKRYYLFYSANSYASTRYAIGYLICKSWKGDCRKPRKKPLIATVGAIAGPGGPAPFVDSRGRLRLGYHAWRAGQVGYPTTLDCQLTSSCGQRRLYVATLAVKANGRLRVVRTY